MNYGIISDNQSNYEALQATLGELEPCPGDIVGHGLDLEKCCETLRSFNISHTIEIMVIPYDMRMQTKLCVEAQPGFLRAVDCRYIKELKGKLLCLV